MTAVNLILTGPGNVGRAFLRLVREKKRDCRERYGLDLRLTAVLKSDGGFLSEKESDLEGIADLAPDEFAAHPAWKPSLKLGDVLSLAGPGVLVECTPTNLATGEPGLGFLTEALGRGWNAAVAGKGALVLNFRGLRDLARRHHVALKYSGATAAALPTLDTGLVALAGTEIRRIEGILTGVTNLILARMEEGRSFDEALKEAQARGIAEPDPSLDIDGWDTACKILLIANSVAGTDFQLSEIRREGIRQVTREDILRARTEGQALKLLGLMTREGGRARAEVRVAAVESSHPLFGVSGTNKAISFVTDTMGTVTVSGGKSDPRGTAAALLKDIINMYRRDI